MERIIKKTMVNALAFVTANGNMSAENLELFTVDFCIPSTKTSGESKPREITKLYDIDGNLLGGRCNATMLWFEAADFNHHHGISKQGQNVKGRLNTQAKEVEKVAADLLVSIKDITDPMEKLEGFEAYDAKMGEAKTIRETVVTVEDFTEAVTSFDTIEALAEDLGVEVITSKPAKVKETTETEEA